MAPQELLSLASLGADEVPGSSLASLNQDRVWAFWAVQQRVEFAAKRSGYVSW